MFRSMTLRFLVPLIMTSFLRILSLRLFMLWSLALRYPVLRLMVSILRTLSRLIILRSRTLWSLVPPLTFLVLLIL